jgi:hypothetical protein
MTTSEVLSGHRTRLLKFYNENETRLDILFFIGGFCFDVLMASEIGEPVSVIQQVLYLFLIASLIHYEILFRNAGWMPPAKLEKFWQYRGLPLHFFLGGLLNTYSIFYIKSASFFNSVSFLILLIGAILANELPVVKRSHVSSKVAMYGICLFSFISMMYPFLMGFVGWIPFGLSIATTLWFFYLQYRLLKKSIANEMIVFRSLLAPAVGVLAFFSVFYFFGLIPPVPLSVSEQGIYHNVEKRDGGYFLSAEKQAWNLFGFSNFGSQVFHAQPGDKIYFYAQIFSPSRFADAIFVQWSWKDPRRGWQTQDRIPLNIVGGRREGFRGYTVKSNFQPGEWRVQVQSANAQEISRMYFEVKPVPAEERAWIVMRR